MTNAGSAAGSGRLAARLRAELRGDVLFDRASRGRYATDASIYQIEPVGVVIPRDERDVELALAIARDERVPVLPRGAGTSQCGQAVGAALILECTRHLNEIVSLDADAGTVTVQPGVVLDTLNAWLKPHGLFYPVDVSTAAQATIGGMTGNNSCGARSLHYGIMVDNVRAIDAWLASGELLSFGEVGGDLAGAHPRYRELVASVRSIREREAREIEARLPRVQRRVAGYNLDRVAEGPFNMASLLVGSEGTLACFRSIELALSAIPRHKVLGVVHFPSFHQAMDDTRHIVALSPTAVELVDATMIALSRAIPAFRDTIDRVIRGEPQAVLLVEFSGEDREALLGRLAALDECMGELGLPGSVVELTDTAAQREFWQVRKAGLNIMMSMKGDGKPVSFIEDCAVPLEHLAEYTDAMTRVLRAHGVQGTWYAHASVGCLHLRPVLNLKTEDGARSMRAIAEEACELVRKFKGSYSSEHGDGLVRSEWIAPMFGQRLVRAFEQIKEAFDPAGLMNPGKIVHPSKMDDRSLFRYKPGYHTETLPLALDWSEWGGLAGAVEMCNNNGHCRKADAGVMCPSFRATADERHLTRGRANTLRLALSGQLAPDALGSDAVRDAMELCVSCKGCKRECPTGVDMARMKIEFLHQYYRRHRLPLGQRLVAWLPRYAPYAARIAPLMNLRNRSAVLRALGERFTGLSRRRALPVWHASPFLETGKRGTGSREVVLWVDTFNRYFEPANAHAALAVLQAAGYSVHLPGDAGGRPLCCGRTFLSAGLVEQARAEAGRTLDALLPFARRGIPILGLEPSCLLGMRDEFAVMLPGETARTLASHALLFEEFLAREDAAGRLRLELKPVGARTALLHGHCHQRAFGVMESVERVLALVPGLETKSIEASCCGMAGAFGYAAAHYDVSMQMGEAALLPAVRAAGADTLLVADGTSCRHQIADGAGREALHVARVLAMAL